MDKEMLEYILKEIDYEQQHGNYFLMHNEPAADEMFPYIQGKYPNVIMVKVGLRQYFAVSEQTRKAIKEQLEENKRKHLEDIEILDKAIAEL